LQRCPPARNQALGVAQRILNHRFLAFRKIRRQRCRRSNRRSGARKPGCVYKKKRPRLQKESRPARPRFTTRGCCPGQSYAWKNFIVFVSIFRIFLPTFWHNGRSGIPPQRNITNPLVQCRQSNGKDGTTPTERLTPLAAALSALATLTCCYASWDEEHRARRRDGRQPSEASQSCALAARFIFLEPAKGCHKVLNLAVRRGFAGVEVALNA
jgi:hypothetical protein